ncbi:MAG: hypothetical protein PHW60_03620 [Kiritimatiellae bacterium]|nr:hypothetical protein [Kiritimatiellia bacterium]
MVNQKHELGEKALTDLQNGKDDNFREMIAVLRSQYEKVKAQTAFLDLKQSELRPGDEISFFGYLQAKEELTIEQSLLSGHAWMLQTMAKERELDFNLDTRRLLAEIRNIAA